MQPLPHAPRSFRDIVEADLRRAARLIIKVQDEIDWQWRIATPVGDFHIAMTMPQDASERAGALLHVGRFMHWKRALAFVLASELSEPDAVYAVGVAAHERHNCMAAITRTPKPWSEKNFSAVEWLPVQSIDNIFMMLLPLSIQALTNDEVRAMAAWFGVQGKFPAVHVPTGQITGV